MRDRFESMTGEEIDRAVDNALELAGLAMTTKAERYDRYVLLDALAILHAEHERRFQLDCELEAVSAHTIEVDEKELRWLRRVAVAAENMKEKVGDALVFVPNSWFPLKEALGEKPE